MGQDPGRGVLKHCLPRPLPNPAPGGAERVLLARVRTSAHPGGRDVSVAPMPVCRDVTWLRLSVSESAGHHFARSLNVGRSFARMRPPRQECDREYKVRRVWSAWEAAEGTPSGSGVHPWGSSAIASSSFLWDRHGRGQVSGAKVARAFPSLSLGWLLFLCWRGTSEAPCRHRG